MLRRTLKVSLALDRAVVLPNGTGQLCSDPGAGADVYLPDVADLRFRVLLELDRLADLDVHCESFDGVQQAQWGPLPSVWGWWFRVCARRQPGDAHLQPTNVHSYASVLCDPCVALMHRPASGLSRTQVPNGSSTASTGVTLLHARLNMKHQTCMCACIYQEVKSTS